jgi:hypothetical protein
MSQIELIHSYLQSVQNIVQGFKLFSRRHVFDLSVLGLLSKAFSISNAALILIESGHSEEAYGLSRSLVECAMNLRYLTLLEDRLERENRAWKFAKFFHKEKRYWLYQAKQWITDASALAEMDKYAAESGVVPDSKAASEHWSGFKNFVWECVNMNHPLDDPTYSLATRKIEYAIEYHATSAFVHCSQASIEHLLPPEDWIYVPELKPSGDTGQAAQRALFIILRYVHVSTRYAMFGMEIENTRSLDEEFKNTLAALEPVERRYKPELVYRRVF